MKKRNNAILAGLLASLLVLAGTGRSYMGSVLDALANGTAATLTGDVTITGTLNSTGKVVSVTTGVGSETVLTQAQSGSLVDNTGTTVKASCKLPASPTVGTYYDFLCDDADGLRVVCNTSQTLSMETGLGSTAGGLVLSVDDGDWSPR